MALWCVMSESVCSSSVPQADAAVRRGDTVCKVRSYPRNQQGQAQLRYPWWEECREQTDGQREWVKQETADAMKDTMTRWVVLAQDTQIPYSTIMSVYISIKNIHLTCTSLQMFTWQSHSCNALVCLDFFVHSFAIYHLFHLHRNNSSFTNGLCLFSDVSYPCTSTDIYWPSSDNKLCAFTQDGWNDGYGLNY